MKRKISYVFLVFLSWFIIHSIYIINDGLKAHHQKADLAVVLGNKVNKNGTLSDRLRARLDCGLDLYKNHQVKKILVSGGLGKEGFYEGTKMQEFLIKNSVPKEDIIVDNFGNDTEATVRNTLKLRDSLHFNSVIVVSQYFHITRTKKLFKDHRFYNVTGASPNYFELRDVYSIIREFFAYYLD